jgi:hypothetical protein
MQRAPASPAPVSFFDEDWGRLVLSGAAPDSRDPQTRVCHQIGVYTYPEEARHAAGSQYNAGWLPMLTSSWPRN